MTTLVARARIWVTAHHLAQLALLVQPLIVFRTAGEYLRLRWVGDAALPNLIDPLFASIAAVGIAAMASLLLYFNARDRSVIALTLVGIFALIAYKSLAMPGLS